MENGKDAICFASGLAATDAILKLLGPKDEVIASNDLYGGTYRLMRTVFGPYGIQSHFIDMTNPDNVKNYIKRGKTKLIWIETPTNPMLSIIDIKRICKIAKSNGIMVCVDNTFASPYLQNPIDLGADMVVHSATKYLGGHSDVILGAVITKSKKLSEQLHYLQNASGAVPGPQDCFLILRGIKTLARPSGTRL